MGKKITVSYRDNFETGEVEREEMTDYSSKIKIESLRMPDKRFVQKPSEDARKVLGLPSIGSYSIKDSIRGITGLDASLSGASDATSLLGLPKEAVMSEKTKEAISSAMSRAVSPGDPRCGNVFRERQIDELAKQAKITFSERGSSLFRINMQANWPFDMFTIQELVDNEDYASYFLDKHELSVYREDGTFFVTKDTKVKVTTGVKVDFDNTIDPDYYKPPSWFKTLEQFIDANMRVLLIGPAGAGKSEAVERIFKKRGQRLRVVSCNPAMTADDLEGRLELRSDPVSGATTTKFELAVPAVALRDGEGLLLDETDALTAEASFSLFRLLDGRSMHVLRSGVDTEIQPHENFRVIGTQNTEGRGDSNGQYFGRSFQDEALLDRWTAYIRVDYPSKEDQVLLLGKITGITESAADKITIAASMMREQAGPDGMPVIRTAMTLRRQIAIAKMIKSGLSEEDAWVYGFISRCVQEEKPAIIEVLLKVYGARTIRLRSKI